MVAAAELDTLQSLVDKSLVRVREGDRFWMLETIAEYALERLEASGEEDELRSRHAAWFLAFAEVAAPHVADESSGGGREWLDRVERDHDNLRAAFEHFEAAGEAYSALRLAGALGQFWRARRPAEGQALLRRALAADERPSDARAAALDGAAELALILGDVGTARDLATQALALHRSHGDTRSAAISLQKLGVCAVEDGDLARARELLEDSIATFREAGDEVYALWTTRTLGWTYDAEGDDDRARELHEATLERARALGLDLLVAALLGSLGSIAVEQGRPADSVELARESLPLCRKIGDRVELTNALCRAAHALAHVGHAGPAARLLATCDAAIAELGGTEGWVARMNDETRRLARARLGDERFRALYESSRELPTDEGADVALDDLAAASKAPP